MIPAYALNLIFVAASAVDLWTYVIKVHHYGFVLVNVQNFPAESSGKLQAKIR